MKLLLRNVHGLRGRCDIRVAGRRIRELGRGLASRRREITVDGRGFVALPGLINAHDHLPLNLLPHLGTPPYPNLYAFADAIHDPEATPIRELVHGLDPIDRFRWGAYKNLIAGVTTVAHHDPVPKRLWRRTLPIALVRRQHWSHSPRYGPDPARAYRRGRPFVIHAAEGVDSVAAGEIEALDAQGVLAPNTVLVHAIAVGPAQQQTIAARGCGVVWCPHSNRRLYDAVAPIAALRRKGVRVALGTDSTLSGAATLLHELRDAHATGEAGIDALLAMVTTEAAAMFQLRDGRGRLTAGGPADLVLLPDRGGSPAASLLAAGIGEIALVLGAGRPLRASEALADRLELGPTNASIDGTPSWLVGDLASLRRTIEAGAGDAPLAANPLWTILRSTADAAATVTPSSHPPES